MSLFIALPAPAALASLLDELVTTIEHIGPLPRAAGLRALGGRAPFHLTLAFLGSPDEEGRSCARRALSAAEGLEAPRLSLCSLFGLPPGRRHGVLCLGADERPEGARRLASLHDALNRRLRALEGERGLGPLNADWPGRPLLPHLSIARPRGGSFRPEDAREAAIRMRDFRRAAELEAPWTFDSCILYESSGGSGGSSYKDLAAVRLDESGEAGR